MSLLHLIRTLIGGKTKCKEVILYYGTIMLYVSFGTIFMEFSKLTTKHQATIPKQIRNKLALQAGDYIQFQERDGQVIVTKVERVDREYLSAVEMTLESEWLSEADETAYADL